MQKSEIIFVLKSFLIWRLGIFLITIFAVRFVPLLSHNYLGGGYSNYISNPIFWGHLNFDGEHYLSIAQSGYQPLQFFFFPLFPLLVKTLSLNGSQITLAITGILISNVSFLIALIGFFKLIKLDFEEKIAKHALFLLLLFPTSFYFGIYYTESLFLMLIVWSFYFVRKSEFVHSSVIAAFASATRLVGGIMFPVLVIETFIQKKKNFLPILIAPIGILIYMYYLFKKTGDALIFLHQVSIFGEQRSSTLITLPQVIYRYVFKILPNVSYNYFPNLFTTYLEFGISILFLLLIIYGFWKLRASYSFYAFFAFLIPTLAGSFSSMPRYVLTIFPVFILMATIIHKLPKVYVYLLFSVMILILVICESMFWRGYWIS